MPRIVSWSNQECWLCWSAGMWREVADSLEGSLARKLRSVVGRSPDAADVTILLSPAEAYRVKRVVV